MEPNGRKEKTDHPPRIGYMASLLDLGPCLDNPAKGVASLCQGIVVDP